MGLIDLQAVTRLPVPHEPDHWVDVRRMPGSEVRHLPERAAAAGTDVVTMGLVQQLVAWSYDAPVAIASVDRLDTRTLLWLMGVCQRHQDGELTDDEKKDATSRSSASSPASETSTPMSPMDG